MSNILRKYSIMFFGACLLGFSGLTSAIYAAQEDMTVPPSGTKTVVHNMLVPLPSDAAANTANPQINVKDADIRKFLPSVMHPLLYSEQTMFNALDGNLAGVHAGFTTSTFNYYEVAEDGTTLTDIKFGDMFTKADDYENSKLWVDSNPYIMRTIGATVGPDFLNLRLDYSDVVGCKEASCFFELNPKVNEIDADETHKVEFLHSTLSSRIDIPIGTKMFYIGLFAQIKALGMPANQLAMLSDAAPAATNAPNVLGPLHSVLSGLTNLWVEQSGKYLNKVLTDVITKQDVVFNEKHGTYLAGVGATFVIPMGDSVSYFLGVDAMLHSSANALTIKQGSKFIPKGTLLRLNSGLNVNFTDSVMLNVKFNGTVPIDSSMFKSGDDVWNDKIVPVLWHFAKHSNAQANVMFGNEYISGGIGYSFRVFDDANTTFNSDLKGKESTFQMSHAAYIRLSITLL